MYARSCGSFQASPTSLARLLDELLYPLVYLFCAQSIQLCMLLDAALCEGGARLRRRETDSATKTFSDSCYSSTHQIAQRHEQGFPAPLVRGWEE